MLVTLPQSKSTQEVGFSWKHLNNIFIIQYLVFYKHIFYPSWTN